MLRGDALSGNGLLPVEGITRGADIVMALVGPDDQPGQRLEHALAIEPDRDQAGDDVADDAQLEIIELAGRTLGAGREGHDAAQAEIEQAARQVAAQPEGLGKVPLEPGVRGVVRDRF